MSTSNSVYTSAFSRRFRTARHGTARHASSTAESRRCEPFRRPRIARGSEPRPTGRQGVHYPLRRRVHATICGVSRGRRVAASFPPRNVLVVTIPRRFRGGRIFEYPAMRSWPGKSWSRCFKTTFANASRAAYRGHGGASDTRRNLSRSIDVLSFGVSLGQR